MRDVAILGATGIVGQKVIALLQCHKKFKIAELVASEHKKGMQYKQACVWRDPNTILDPKIAEMHLKSLHNIESHFVISCLPSEIASEIELKLSSEGKIIFSNASAFRMQPDVPLLIPEINPHHLALLNKQSAKGKIITNPNCVVVGLSLALAPLLELGQIQHVSVVTLQSTSGAGYNGVSSMDLLGNTIPHIQGEAEKITEETKKILGEPKMPVDFAITTNVHRVPVLFGHTLTLHATFVSPIHQKDALNQYLKWNDIHGELFVLHDDPYRPQATKDLSSDDMRIHIGHIKAGDRDNILRIVALSHNLVRGAAGAVIANMECYLKYVE